MGASVRQVAFHQAVLAAGLSNGEIARELMISGQTVKTLINHVFSKPAREDRAQAIRYAHDLHLTSEPRPG